MSYPGMGMLQKRYPTDLSVISSLDPTEDALVWLEFLTAEEQVVKVLTERHALSPRKARERAKHIVPHMRYAIAYLRDALGDVDDVGLLSAYYGILNLLKVYVLVGPHHDELSRQRYHGVVYSGINKRAHTLFSDTVALKRKGAIPLAYQTITGESLERQAPLVMGSIYSYIASISSEYQEAAEAPGKIAWLAFSRIRDDRPRLTVTGHQSGGQLVGQRQLPVLKRGKWKLSGDLYSHSYSPADDESDWQSTRDCIHPFLLYHAEWIPMQPKPAILTAVSGGKLLLPEELPLALAFFHLSSIVRYNPEFLARLRDSRHWPVVVSLRRHGLYRAMILAVSFVFQRNLEIRR